MGNIYYKQRDNLLYYQPPYTHMGSVEEKIKKIESLLQKGITVKMRRADGAKQIEGISTKNGVIIIKFTDGELLFLTEGQFMNRDVITEKEKNTNINENEIENMLNTLQELKKEGYKLFLKGKKIVNIRKEGNLIITETEDGTIYTQSQREFLESYKTARVK
ncbi:MAG: hypothetical protein OWT28_01415 [Firmicutes bacterium]|nr:hypothetical protein [Bacillota bacterium]